MAFAFATRSDAMVDTVFIRWVAMVDTVFIRWVDDPRLVT